MSNIPWQKLSPFIIFVVVGAALMAVAGGIYLSQRRSAEPSPTPAAAVQTQNAAPEEASPAGQFSTTLTDLIGRGQSLECDWQMPASPAKRGEPASSRSVEGVGDQRGEPEPAEDSPFTTGKLWTTGRQGRSSITANINGVSMEANAIYRDDQAYVWMNTMGTKMGFQFSPDDLDNTSMTEQQRQQAEQVRQEMVFNCQPWTPDESKFVLPSDITFREM